jgi:asparagine synthase (glutamine-hydrolysing)
MCGIAGLWHLSARHGAIERDALDRARVALAHRGPDADGIWMDPAGCIGLAHTRLAIVDLSPTGAQPMRSRDGRYVTVFNGEIYNHEELRQSLRRRGANFRGTSDTEVLLELYAERGERALNELDGMFAFAIWDTRDRALFLARDALGEKPLYVLSRDGRCAFASEVRALLAAGISSGSLDLTGLGLFLRQGSIAAPYTHIQDIELLPPGSWRRIAASGEVTERTYWRFHPVPESLALTDRNEAVERVRDALRRSAKRRLRADVPVGSFLSGGLDSALVTALLVEAGAQHLQTFTVTQPGQAFDEAAPAREVAAFLGTRHTEIPLELDARHDWLDQALDAMDVPSNDGPNTWLVARAARQAGLKVATSGLGGDELFFGYPSFLAVRRAALYTRWLSPLGHVRGAARALMPRLPAPPRVGRALDAALSGASVAALYFAKRGLFAERELRELLSEATWQVSRVIDPIARLEGLGCPPGLSIERQVSFYELNVYMRDQLLRDTDVMSMAHGLEVRVPIIARDVVDIVGGLSTSVLWGERPKALLRSVLAPLLPSAEHKHPKLGFALNWKQILRDRPLPPDPTLGGVLRPGAWETQRDLLATGRAGFARVFVLEVLRRKMDEFGLSTVVDPASFIPAELRVAQV